jgi:hypothetical protein
MGAFDIPGIDMSKEPYSLIFSDPSYMTAKSSLDMGLANASSARRSAIRALVTQYGDLGNVKDQYGDQYGDLDQATLDAAKGNEYSDLAKLQRSYEQGQESFKRSLAARGALSSGDLGYGLGQLDWQQGQSRYDLGTAEANSANQILGGYGSAEANYYQQLAAAMMQAFQGSCRGGRRLTALAARRRLRQGLLTLAEMFRSSSTRSIRTATTSTTTRPP